MDAGSLSGNKRKSVVASVLQAGAGGLLGISPGKPAGPPKDDPATRAARVYLTMGHAFWQDRDVDNPAAQVFIRGLNEAAAAAQANPPEAPADADPTILSLIYSSQEFFLSLPGITVRTIKFTCVVVCLGSAEGS